MEKDLLVISNQPLCDEFFIKHSSAFDTHMKLLSEYIDGIKGLNLTHKVAINKFIEEINRGHLHLLQQVFLNQSINQSIQGLFVQQKFGYQVALC